MANEITITKTITYVNGTLKYTYQPGSIGLPQTAKGYVSQTVSITTAETDITFAGLDSHGIVVLHNLEPTTTGGSITYGPKSSTGGLPVDAVLGILRAKQLHDLCMASSTCTLRCYASAGTVLVQAICFEK